MIMSKKKVCDYSITFMCFIFSDWRFVYAQKDG